MKRTIFLCLVLCFMYINSTAQNCYENVNSDDFNLIIETKDVVIIDVRLYRKYRKERIPNAKIASTKEALTLALNGYDRKAYVLVYCDEGDRSKTAANILCNELKFKRVYNLDMGLDHWKKRGYKTDRAFIKRSE